ncbi:MAG: electron transport complex subunit RsxA [Nanoarchaeota archaeon]
MESLFAIIIGAMLVNNFILTRFLGLCPFFGVSKKTSSALGMGTAVMFVMSLSSIIVWLIHNLLLIPFGLEYLQIITFILTIAVLVQFVEIFLKKFNTVLYKSLGIYLPLITTNCAILGVALLNVQENYNLLESLVFGLSAGVGFTLALLLMSGIRERLEHAKIPKSMQGIPIAFIIASIMSMAFMAFSGMIK